MGRTFVEYTNVTLSATASDIADPIEQVQFYHFSTLLGTATLTNGYYDMGLDQSSGRRLRGGGGGDRCPRGELRIGRSPFQGQSHQSAAIGGDPISPTNSGPDSQTAQILRSSANATANVTNGWVTNVEFLVNGNSIGSIETPPYNLTQCCWTPGTYVLECDCH